jgi:hypothetical protein
LLCNNSVTSIDNTQLSLYLGYKRKVSYSHCSHIQSYICIRVLCSSGSLCSSYHVRPTVPRDLWLYQYSDEHCHGPSHSSLLTGLPYPNKPNEQPPASGPSDRRHTRGTQQPFYLEAASGSSIDISGVDQTVRVKTVDNLNVKMSGVDRDDIQIQMPGVDNKAYVNGNSGCDDVTTPGVDNNCYITEKTVSFPELECVASTKVVNWSAWSVSDTTAVACGIVLGVLVVAIFGCVFCCCRRQKRNIITREEKPPAQAARKDIPFGVEETAADPRKDNAFGLEAAAYTT